MFAGPNGSGKSTLKAYLPPALLGFYLNPDELEQSIRASGFLDFSEYGITTASAEILPFLAQSTLLSSAGLAHEIARLHASGSRLEFNTVPVNAYFASVICDYVRQKLMARQVTFTVETVMSHPGKISLLERAQSMGYRTYLYFIATDDPTINISRVQNRVRLGGHAVPVELIQSRYERSLGLLMEAIRHTNRAYIFDNSGDSADERHTWLAEITDGRRLELKTNLIPSWFKKSVLDRIGSTDTP